MFRNLFNPETPLMVTMAQISDCIFLSLFWLICCFPVVTAGAATAALYDAVYHAFRKGDKHSWLRFFRSFRRNLKGSILSTVGFLALSAVLVKAAVGLWNSAVYGNISWMLFAAGAFFVFVISGILGILFPMLSRFENSTAALWGNTFRLAMAKLPLTMGVAAVNGVCMFFCVLYLFPLFFLPALACLLDTLFIEPMFKPYMPAEDAA